MYFKKITGGDQELSMGFGMTANSTFVPDSTMLCNSSATDFNRCLFWRGGLYTPEQSSTWTKDKGTGYFNGSVSNEGWDTLNAAKYEGRDICALVIHGLRVIC
jgi:hypothetical protein